MNLLELFAGSRSIGKVANSKGMQVFSTDIEQFGGIDYVADILNFDFDAVTFVPDIIWASPPCTGFSVAAIGHHWQGGGESLPTTYRDCKAWYKTCRKNNRNNRTLQKNKSESSMVYRESTRASTKDAHDARFQKTYNNLLSIWRYSHEAY